VGYVAIKKNAGTEYEVVSAERWLTGDLAAGFKAFLICGTLVPLLMISSANPAVTVAASFCVLLGGALMRLLTVQAGETRTMLPGEEDFRSRLPLGDEAFLTAWRLG
jgi:hypothetical protein